MELKQLIEEFQEWQEQTFVDETDKGVVDHLLSEVKELEVELKGLETFPDKNTAVKELVDILFLSFCISKKLGMSTEDLIFEMKLKFAINKERTWRKINSHYRHV